MTRRYKAICINTLTKFANQSSMHSATTDNNLQFLSWYSIPAFRLKASIKAVSCKT